uniref:C2H2-type domain-containing protein n=1 Tax=Marseillevirus LCMAC101 TaxID=2506602 RepID=A0A481YR11_9VIRU|nr:MAG: hypothetical protein LCMAC101_00860 [Marseillevirus LCMAC101]
MSEDFTQKKRMSEDATQNYLFECNFCNKEFSNKQNVLRHQKTSCKEKSPYEEFKCKYCSRIFYRKNNLDRHLNTCSLKKEYKLKKEIRKLENNHRDRSNEWKKERKHFKLKLGELEEIIKEKDEEITALRVKCEVNKTEVYTKVCDKVLDKSTVTNNTAYIHPKLVNLPITNIHPLTEGYVKERVSNGDYTFDHYLKGENGLVDFIYSITMCENDNGDLERNYVCTDPSRDSYHRLVETKEWQKDKGGKFVDVILDTLSDKVDNYHQKMFGERHDSKSHKPKSGYDPEYIFKLNTDMHSGVVQSRGKDRRTLRQRIKKETSRKITV